MLRGSWYERFQVMSSGIGMLQRASVAYKGRLQGTRGDFYGVSRRFNAFRGIHWVLWGIRRLGFSIV